MQVIRRLEKYAAVIDDVMVPGKSDPHNPHGRFGFDVYKGQILSWAYIADIFSDRPVRIFYPQRPNRDQRGWVLMIHGYSEEELTFLDTLDLFELDPHDPKHASPIRATWRTRCDLRNVLKKIVPVSLLRWGHRYYEWVMVNKNLLLAKFEK